MDNHHQETSTRGAEPIKIRLMKDILKLILSDFKWYRRKQGGTWFLIAFPHYNSTPIWIDVLPTDGAIILKVEHYG